MIARAAGAGKQAEGSAAALEVPVVVLAGELDISRRNELRATLSHTTRRSPYAICDLSRVRFLDSTALMELYRFRSERKRVALVVGNTHQLRLLRITGLDGAFVLSPTLDDALNLLLASAA